MKDVSKTMALDWADAYNLYKKSGSELAYPFEKLDWWLVTGTKK